MIYAHVLYRGPAAVRSPADTLRVVPPASPEIGCSCLQRLGIRQFCPLVVGPETELM